MNDTRRSSAHITRYKSQLGGLHRRKSMFSHSPRTDEDDEKAIFVHVGNITTKDVFVSS